MVFHLMTQESLRLKVQKNVMLVKICPAIVAFTSIKK